MPLQIVRPPPPAASDRAQAAARASRARTTVATLLAAALGWLVFGGLGLLWTIAFTADARSMVIGLAVWVFCFVVPSTLATVVAYRVDERVSAGRSADRPRPQRGPLPAGGD